jgi:hypothetical protein
MTVDVPFGWMVSELAATSRRIADETCAKKVMVAGLCRASVFLCHGRRTGGGLMRPSAAGRGCVTEMMSTTAV